jgi:hypothetical protein
MTKPDDPTAAAQRVAEFVTRWTGLSGMFHGQHIYGISDGRNTATLAVADLQALIEASTPRLITTIEELDSLKADTTIRSEQGGIWYREVSGPGAVWREPGTTRKHRGEDITLPAKVLDEPDA